MINLIFGRAGSGKTYTITEKIKESIKQKRRTYLLVPEQQVFTAEKLFLELEDNAALYFEVTSFSRMCELVFSEYGGLGYTAVSGGARNLVMWKSIQEMHTALSNYGKTMPDAKFASLMLATMDEISASSYTLEDLETAVSKIERPDIKNKMSDIVALIAAYNINLEKTLKEGAVEAENKFRKLYETLRKNDFFSGADVYVDSFTDFTGIQYKILSKIMEQADNMYISVNLPDPSYVASHTVSANDTASKLNRLATNSGNTLGDPIILGENLRTASPQLKLLEKHLWDFSAKKANLPKLSEENSHDIEMICCADEYEEIECAALKILQARKSGMNYSDIAIILRNPEDRSGIIHAVFSKYNIPFFISEKMGLMSTPASRFLLSSLRCISKNYRLEDVITLLKTDLCNVKKEDADLFEEYCRKWNIQGKLFTEKVWSMNANGYVTDARRRDPRAEKILAAANRVRGVIIDPLEKLKIKFHNAKNNAGQFCRELYSYIEERKLAENLCNLAEEELKHGSISNVKEAGEILRIYDALLSAISGLYKILKDTEISVDDLASALEIMLTHTEIASVPALGECVTIGSAATLRVENIKLAIIMEMCEGIFPALPKDTGLMNESDKDELSKHNILFKARHARLMSDELFYIYRAMTKPSQKLILTTYTSSMTGGKKTPSVAWNRILTLFGTKVEKIDIRTLKELAKKQLEAAACKNIDEYSELAQPQEVEETTETAISDDITDANTEQNPYEEICIETIPYETVREIFKDGISLTKSTIQQYAKCPMLYWSNATLDLRARTQAEVGASESGTLIHYVLEKLFKEIRDEDGSLQEKTPDQLLELTNQYVNQYVDLINCPRTPALMFIFSKLRNMAYIMASNISEEFAASQFKMVAFEQKIRKDDEDRYLKPYIIDLSSVDKDLKVYLGGEADRIDTYTKDGVTYVRVIDYKTGNTSFDRDDVPTGEDVQLPAYLFSIASSENRAKLTNEEHILAGSSLYLSAVEHKGKISIVRSGIILKEDEYLRATNKDLDYGYISTAAQAAQENDTLDKCPELFTKEEIDEMKVILTDTVKATATQIYSGEIKRTPSASSCKFCPVRESCPVACKSKY